MISPIFYIMGKFKENRKSKKMSGMFEMSSNDELDLSSFKISSVIDMGWMFKSHMATTGYAKDKAADRINDASITHNPHITFTVKQIKKLSNESF